jgi:hypothetical protein
MKEVRTSDENERRGGKMAGEERERGKDSGKIISHNPEPGNVQSKVLQMIHPQSAQSTLIPLHTSAVGHLHHMSTK